MATLPILATMVAALSVGAACLGAALVLVRRVPDALAEAFLRFYLPFTLVVLTGVLIATLAARGPPGTGMGVLDYLESFPGRYALMAALPWFAHRVFGVRAERRERTLLWVVAIAFLGQHVTEFVLGGAWDRRGDVAEDLLFAGFFVYTVGIALRHRHDAVYGPLGTRFLVLLLAGTPVFVHDVLMSDGPGLRLYPIWYAVLGLGMVLTLAARSFDGYAAIPPGWRLSPREREVVGLVRRGLSNREIADQLFISPNTVKTHLRAVFDKSGFRTRVALVAALSGSGADAPSR